MYGEFLGTSKGGPKEGTLEHFNLEKPMEFSYQTLLGEMMFACVTCHPDIAYALTTLSNFSIFLQISIILTSRVSSSIYVV